MGVESLFLYRYKNGFMYVRSKHSDILCLFLYYKTINIVLNLDTWSPDPI